jgi:hypothetical protein
MQGTLADLVKGDRRPILVRSPRLDELRALLEEEGAAVMPDGRPDAMIVQRSSLETIGTLAADHGIPLLELTGERGNVR